LCAEKAGVGGSTPSLATIVFYCKINVVSAIVKVGHTPDTHKVPALQNFHEEAP
jgi:hypothetical protein